jgi:hypothetical protein
MTNDETLEQLRSYEQEYQEYRRLFETDGEISTKEKAQLDRIDDMIKKLRSTIENKASAEAGGETTAAGLKAELEAAIRRNGGINIGIFLTVLDDVGMTKADAEKIEDKAVREKMVKKCKNAAEFERQGKVWAGNHGAFGVIGNTLKKDYCMALLDDPAVLIRKILKVASEALGGEGGASPAVPIANVAFFTHGSSGGGLEVDVSRNSRDGSLIKEAEKRKANSPTIKDFAAAVKPFLTEKSKIMLFACGVSKDKKDGNSFAEELQEITGAEVWGHETSAHTTGNPALVMSDDTNADGDAESFRVRDALAIRFIRSAAGRDVSDADVGRVDAALKISDWLKKVLSSAHVKKLAKSERFNAMDRHQIFIEEIAMLGYDRLFEILSSTTPPSASVMQSYFPEHDQIDKLVEGTTEIYDKYQKLAEDKSREVRSHLDRVPAGR